MIAWESNGEGDYILTLYCDDCGQQCNTWKRDRYIRCEEINGKHYCSDCMSRYKYMEVYDA